MTLSLGTPECYLLAVKSEKLRPTKQEYGDKKRSDNKERNEIRCER